MGASAAIPTCFRVGDGVRIRSADTQTKNQDASQRDTAPGRS